MCRVPFLVAGSFVLCSLACRALREVFSWKRTFCTEAGIFLFCCSAHSKESWKILQEIFAV